MKLNRTAVVLLGMLTKGPLSGYDVKRLIQISTSHFWNASYGQIYPEFRRLEQAGLVAASPQEHGRRARTAYALTEAGRRALRDWLVSPGELELQMRDEGLLRLFFADQLEPDEAIALLRRMRALYAARAAELRAVCVPTAEAVAAEDDLRFPLLTAGMGIELYDTLAGWCERTERELAAGA